MTRRVKVAITITEVVPGGAWEAVEVIDDDRRVLRLEAEEGRADVRPANCPEGWRERPIHEPPGRPKRTAAIAIHLRSR